MDLVKVAQFVGAAVTLVTTTAIGVTLAVEVSVHRRHLNDAIDDLQRLARLHIRLRGCVTDLERRIERGVSWDGEDQLPDSLVGLAVYLHAIRDECEDHAARATVHGARLRWPQGFISRIGLTARRCRAAHEALEVAASNLAKASRGYEEGLQDAYLRYRGQPVVEERLQFRQPLALLDERVAEQLTSIRTETDRAMRMIAEHARRDHPFWTDYRCSWPIRRSEVPMSVAAAYGNEPGPLGWDGLGGRPILHVDAR